MINVLLADDHQVVREGLKQMLADAGDISVIGECGHGDEVLQQARVLPLDLVLLDIALPGLDGLEVLHRVKEALPRLPVLMLSTYPEKHYAARCFRLGAAGYLNKSTDIEQLVEAIRKAAAGELYVQGATAEALARELNQRRPRLPHELLSQREYQVFQAIAHGRSVKEIADTLQLSPNTVSTYRSRILEKTGASNDVGIAMYAVKHSLIAP